MEPPSSFNPEVLVAEKVEAFESMVPVQPTMWSGANTRATGERREWYRTAAEGFPDRQVIALAGDGGFSMLMSDFLTAVYLDLPITVVVFNNHNPPQPRLCRIRPTVRRARSGRP